MSDMNNIPQWKIPLAREISKIEALSSQSHLKARRRRFDEKLNCLRNKSQSSGEQSERNVISRQFPQKHIGILKKLSTNISKHPDCFAFEDLMKNLVYLVSSTANKLFKLHKNFFSSLFFIETKFELRRRMPKSRACSSKTKRNVES